MLMDDTLFLDVLTELHDRQILNESALRDVARALRAGQAPTLDHLIAIFGVGPIDAILTAARYHRADRVLLRSRFDDVVDALERVDETGSAFDRVDRLVTATTKGFRLLRDVWCPPVAAPDRVDYLPPIDDLKLPRAMDPLRALDAAVPPIDAKRDAP